MHQMKRIFRYSVCILIMAAFFGFSIPDATIVYAQAESSHPGWKIVYSPKIQPGIETLDAAKKDLAELLRTIKRPVGIKFYDQPELNKFANEVQLIEILGGAENISNINYSQVELDYARMKTITALDDRIEVSQRIALFYSDLPESDIFVEKSQDNVCPYIVYLPSRISFHFEKKDLASAQRLADDLFSIQQQMKKPQADQKALFESKAAEYRSLTIKPQVSEEQRKYIVQANALGQKKEYGRAISLYLKAVEVDPVSYPGAYFNLALLSAQMNRFTSAISYMKQYLLLEPEAQDARNAQDKIYEWEIMIEK
jgi:tetratricopeptide (TPR) repeat protein